ncbi:MAG: hypothetical protein J2P21_01375 [Chloracidobacterium sp.]|nr:hypothetical protein [Chloracidobacterium sp.]
MSFDIALLRRWAVAEQLRAADPQSGNLRWKAIGMAKAKKPQFGELPPKYSFVLKPYPYIHVINIHVSRCPYCERKTGQRKLPLLIHVESAHLNCGQIYVSVLPHLYLLIADKQAIEHLLTIIA